MQHLGVEYSVHLVYVPQTLCMTLRCGFDARQMRRCQIAQYLGRETARESRGATVRRARARRTTAAPRRWWTGGRIPDLMVLHNSTFHNRKPAHSSYVVSKSVRLHDVHIYLTFIHNHMVTFMRFIILAVRFSLAAVDWP